MTAPDSFSSPTSRGVTPVDTTGRAKSAVGIGRGWQYALDVALDGIREIVPDAVIVFASAQFADDLPRISEAVWHHSSSMIVIGCASSGVIGRGIELEEDPAISLVALELPGAVLRPVRFTQGMLEDAQDGNLAERAGVEPALVNGWFVLADPFKMDGALLVDRLNTAYPGLPVIGGLLAPSPGQRETWVMLNGQTYGDGGVGLSIGGAFDLMPIVSQGCEPIGETWTITAVEDKWIETISNRPALQMLTETLATLPFDMQLEAQNHLVAGLAANEYRESFGRGDFLIRNIIGIRRETAEIAIGARPRVGQTIQFQLPRCRYRRSRSDCNVAGSAIAAWWARTGGWFAGKLQWPWHGHVRVAQSRCERHRAPLSRAAARPGWSPRARSDRSARKPSFTDLRAVLA